MTTKFGSTVIAGALMAALAIGAPVLAQTAKAPRLTEKELVTLLENAKTSTDHERLAAYYEEEALDFEAKASKHKRLAAAYRRMPAPGNPRIPAPVSAATHCDTIAADATKAGKESRSMADHHKMLAKESGGR